MVITVNNKYQSLCTQHKHVNLSLERRYILAYQSAWELFKLATTQGKATPAPAYKSGKISSEMLSTLTYKVLIETALATKLKTFASLGRRSPRFSKFSV